MSDNPTTYEMRAARAMVTILEGREDELRIILGALPEQDLIELTAISLNYAMAYFVDKYGVDGAITMLTNLAEEGRS